MIENILEILAGIVIFMISKLGYFGIVLAMGIESACIPLPSEIIMPFSGFLVSEGYFNLYLVALTGAVGCLLGSVLAYWIGYKYGESAVRTLIKKYGKFVLVFEYELDEAEHWFCKYGSAITFSSRLMPVVRTFISLPAGIAKMPFKSFAVYTFTGSLIWSFALAWVGKKLGDNWNTLGGYFHKFDFLIVLIFAGLAFYYVYHKLKKHRKHQRKKMEPQL